MGDAEELYQIKQAKGEPVSVCEKSLDALCFPTGEESHYDEFPIQIHTSEYRSISQVMRTGIQVNDITARDFVEKEQRNDDVLQSNRRNILACQCVFNVYWFGRHESTKRRLWSDIGQKVNAVSVTPRSLDELKKRFYDIRSLTKRKMAEIQKQAGVTGGGRNPAPPLTELEELVSSTIERESVTGIGTLDSSARATATGAPSGGQTLPKEAAAPSTTALAGPSTSQAAEEEEENTIGLDIEGDLEIDFDAPHSPQMQSTPSLQFSPENSPTRELFPPTPAPATVAPVHPVLGAGAQAPASTTPPPVAPQPTQQAGSSSTRRRAIPTTADPAREASVFRGLEGNMVKIQRQQAKSIMACQRQLLQHNLQMGEMVKGFQAFVDSNKEAVADGLAPPPICEPKTCSEYQQQAPAQTAA
ncbi:uncharacterized protein LOC144828057 [Lissotriton helveticus]